MTGTEFVGSIFDGRGAGIADGAEMFIGFDAPDAPPPPEGMPGMPALDKLGMGGATPGTGRAIPGFSDAAAGAWVGGIAAG